MVAAIRLVQP